MDLLEGLPSVVVTSLKNMIKFILILLFCINVGHICFIGSSLQLGFSLLEIFVVSLYLEHIALPQTRGEDLVIAFYVTWFRLTDFSGIAKYCH